MFMVYWFSHSCFNCYPILAQPAPPKKGVRSQFGNNQSEYSHTDFGVWCTQKIYNRANKNIIAHPNNFNICKYDDDNINKKRMSEAVFVLKNSVIR